MANTPYQTSFPVATRGVYTFDFTVPWASANIANGDQLTAFVPGHNFRVLGLSAMCNVVAVGAGGTATFTPRINFTASSTSQLTTTGAITVTTANMNTVGKVVGAGNNVNAYQVGNQGGPADSLGVVISGTGGTITSGTITVTLTIQDLDCA
jgi:hypothetical protein